MCLMWWGEEGPTASFQQQPFRRAAEGMGAGFGDAGSYESFQSVAEMRHSCHVRRPMGFLVHWRWRRAGEELGCVPC